MESVTQKSCNLFSAVMILHIWALEHFKVLCFQTWWTINNQHVRKSTLEDVLSLLKFPRPRCLLLAGLFFFLRQFACPTTQGVSGGWKTRQESLQHRRLENIWQFFFAKMMAIHALACSCHIGEYVVLEATALARGNIWSPSSAADGAGRRVGRKAGGHCAQSLAFKK